MKSVLFMLVLVFSMMFSGCDKPPFGTEALNAPVAVIDNTLVGNIPLSTDSNAVYVLPSSSTWGEEYDKLKITIFAVDNMLDVTVPYLQEVRPWYKFWIKRAPDALATAQLVTKYTVRELKASTQPYVTTSTLVNGDLSVANIVFWIPSDSTDIQKKQVQTLARTLLQIRNNLKVTIQYYQADRNTPLTSVGTN